MTPIYLQGVEITNFRAFGERFALKLHNGPSVLLLVGQNGLGKTSFFEAIEWCLTDGVRRLDGLPNNEQSKGPSRYSHWNGGEQGEVCRVLLEFGENAEARMERCVPSTGDGNKRAIHLLAAKPDLNAEADLAQYLHLTHFFTQSQELRFASRDSDDRWECIRGPAGVERPNLLYQRFANPGLSRAFNQVVDRKQRELAEGKEMLEKWLGLLKSRDSIQALVRSGGVKSADELDSQIRALECAIKSSPETQVWPNGIEAMDERLRALADWMEAEKIDIGTEERKLERAQMVLQEWDEAVKSRVGVQASEGSLLETLAATQAHVTSIEKDLENVCVQLELARNLSRSTQDNVTRQSSLLEAMKRRPEEKSALLELEAKVQTLRHGLIVSKERLESLQKSLRDHKSLQNQSAEYIGLCAVTRQLIVRYGKWKASNLLVQNQTQPLAEKENELSQTEERLKSLAAKLSEEKEQTESADFRLQALATQSSEMQQALTRIAAHLTEEAIVCPVCRTDFPPGRLKRLADEAAKLSDANLAEAQQAQELRRKKIQELEEDLESAKRRIVDLKTAIGEIRTMQEGIETERKVLAEDLLPLGIQLLEAQQALQGRIETLEAEQNKIQERIGTFEPVQNQQSVIDHLVQEIQSMEKEKESKEQQLTVLSHRLRATEALLQESTIALDRLPELTTEQDGFLQIAFQEHAKAEQARGEIESRNLSLQRDIADAREKMALAQGALDAKKARLEEIENRLNEIRDQWQKAGFLEVPALEALCAFTRDLQLRKEKLSEWFAAHELAYDSFRKLQKADDLQDLEAQVNKELAANKAKTEDELTKQLEEKVGKARQTVEDAEGAKEFRTCLQQELKDISETYSSTVIKPLDARNEGFLRVLSCFPKHDVSLRPSTQRAKQNLALSVNMGSGAKGTDASFGARYLLSEGELSALSLSLLLSMSTAYQWSKWRALLLDDPVQSNDIIHVAAFYDLMANLVKEEGYQIIVSTHDASLADFARRKLESARIVCKTCQFQGITPKGVVYTEF